MISPEDRMLLSKSIESSRILSTGQKKILKNIIKFEHGIAMSTLVELMNQYKQALFSNIKKLVERGFLIRQKEMVYIYKANEEKMIEIINTYKKIQENK